MAVGTIQNLGKSRGTIRGPGGTEYTFYRADLSEDARNARKGDRVEFEPEDGNGGDNKAANIRKADNKKSADKKDRNRDQSHDRDHNRREDRNKDGGDKGFRGLTISWEFGPTFVQELPDPADQDQKVKALALPVVPTFTQNGKPKAGVSVALMVNNKTIKEQDPWIITDVTGTTMFLALLPEDASLAVLTAIVAIDRKVVGKFTHLWKKDKSKTARFVHVSEHQASEGKVLRLTTTMDEKPTGELAACTLVIKSLAGATLAATEVGTTDRRTGSSLEYDCSGQLSLHIQVESVPQGHFGGDSIVVVIKGTAYESKPVYIPPFRLVKTAGSGK